MEHPARILAVKLRAIGDTVIWTSSLAALREAHPTAEIHAMTFASNEPVLRGNGDIDVLHLVKSRSRLDLALKFLELRRLRFDWLLVFNSYAAVSRWHWLVGARKRRSITMAEPPFRSGACRFPCRRGGGCPVTQCPGARGNGYPRETASHKD